MEITKFSETIYYVDSGCFIKTERHATTFFKRAYRQVFGGALTFQNELGFHQSNVGKSGIGATIEELPKAIFIPRFEESKQQDHNEHLIAIAKSIKSIMKEYVPHDEFGMWKRLVFRIMEAPIWRTFREGLRIPLPIRLRLRFFYKLISLNVKISRLRAYCGEDLIHNDLAPNNLMLNHGKSVLIDFEDTILERNWIFVDVTDLLFSYGSFSYKQGCEFLKENYKNDESNIDDKELLLHAEFGFLRSSVRKAVMSRCKQGERLRNINKLSKYLSGDSA